MAVLRAPTPSAAVELAVDDYRIVVETVFAKAVGCVLPIIAKKMKFDPAVMASPFITTTVVAISLLIYFGFAKVLLHV
mgnify:CR=1 FL=1